MDSNPIIFNQLEWINQSSMLNDSNATIDSTVGAFTELTSSWMTDATTNDLSNVTQIPLDRGHMCLTLLYKNIGTSQVGIWDLMILVPNVIFLLYLLLKSCDAFSILGRNSSPIFIIIFTLIFAAVSISIVRSVVSMVIPSTTSMNILDRVMWLILKFFLLATELSVVTFGLLLVHLDNRTSVRKVVLVAFSFSLIYSVCQGVLEFRYKNEMYHSDVYTLFGHGGLIFWFASSLFLFLIYIVICFLPYTRLAHRLILPTRKSFYFYCLLLAVVDVVQAIGSIVLFLGNRNALCVVDITTFLYFTCFAPFVYIIFLHNFFNSSPTTILFSYRRQNEDEDDVPRQTIDINGDVGSPLENVASLLDNNHYSCGSPLFFGLGSRPELSINSGDAYMPVGAGSKS